MPTTFTHDIALRTERKLAGMLPPGFFVKGAVYNGGRTLGVVVTSGTTLTARYYEFGEFADGTHGPELSQPHLERIVELWEQSDPPPAVNGVPWWRKIEADPDWHEVETADELRAWHARLRGSRAVIYFRHEIGIARFRHDAARRIAELQRLQDQSRRSKARPATEGLEIDTLQQRIELLDTVRKMADAGVLILTQKARTDGPGWVYIAHRPTAKDVT